MEHVYVVTTGEYSDYQIDSIWTTEEKARARIERINLQEFADCPRIEKTCLDKVDDERIECIFLWLSVKTGEVFKEAWYEKAIGPKIEIKNHATEGRLLESTHYTKELALKAAQDYRAKLLAEDAGIS